MVQTTYVAEQLLFSMLLLISSKLPLNLISTSFQLQFQINLSLNSTSTITSTQYGCDIKATQSCFDFYFDLFKYFELKTVFKQMKMKIIALYE